MSETRLDFVNHEPVSGQLLSEKLALGKLPAAEALQYAIDLGNLLARVHGSGQVHGALSPRSIAITAEGMRLLKPLPMSDDHAAYSSPEQLRGGPPDVLSDVFAFGAIAYEMVSGRRAFSGAGADLKRAILNQPPPALMAKSPVHAAMEGVIAGCLEKDPSRRRQRMRNAVIELKLAGRTLASVAGAARRTPAHRALAAEPPAPAAPPVSRIQLKPGSGRPLVKPRSPQGARAAVNKGWKRRIWIIGGAVLALAASSLAAVLYLNKRPPSAVLQFAVTQPEHTSYPGMPAVSPNGRYLTFSAVGPEGKRMLWLRPLDALHAAIVPGTEGASAPFWSPDSEFIAFFAAGNLMKVRLGGGSADTICAAEASPGGGAWNRDGNILFAPGLSGGLYRVAAGGGKPQLVLKLDETRSERGDRWPQFLPDGKHFIFYQQTDSTETSGVYAGTLDPPSYNRLFTGDTNAVYSAGEDDLSRNGYLLYIDERNLMARPFHAAGLQVLGEPIALATEIGAIRSLALAPISVSATGVLVYQGVGQPTRQMVWLDRSGRQIAVAGEPGEYGPPRISPAGDRAVVARLGADGKTARLWLLDAGGGAEPLTGGQVHEGSPVWSPDGSRIAYFAMQPSETYDIYVRAVAPNSKPELLVKSGLSKYPTDWTRDGRYLIFGQQTEGTRLDIWGFATGERRSGPILDTIYAEGFGAVSPDGKWLAYQSDETGRNEVYVQPFDGLTPGTRQRWQVSRGGGLPRWRSDSGELFYITQDGCLMSVSVRAGADGGIEAAPPAFLFQTRPIPQTWNLYDVSGDGQRFLLNMPLEWTSSNPITVVTNWTGKLRD